MKIKGAAISLGVMFILWQIWSAPKDQLLKQSSQYVAEHKQIILRFYGDSAVPKIVLRPFVQGVILQENDATSVKFFIANLSQTPVDLKFDLVMSPAQNFVNWDALAPLRLEGFAEESITLTFKNARPLINAPETIEFTLKTTQANS